MRRIPLTQGKFALVDDEDFSQLIKKNWYYTNCGYAARATNRADKYVKILMHRQIMNAPKGMQVDHINFDKLDNRKENLRLVTPSFNGRHKLMSNNKSGFIGVDKFSNKWRVTIRINGKAKYLGLYPTPEEASQVYQDYVRKIWEDAGYEYIPVSDALDR